MAVSLPAIVLKARWPRLVIILSSFYDGFLQTILSEPEEILAMNGARLPLRLQVAYISFSAHTDYRQSSDFIRTLRPPHIVLVHGEMNEMNRLKAAITREYEDDVLESRIDVYNPANTQVPVSRKISH
jgi:cleavage and polyadenylation specificity factor subunit 3